MSGRKPSATVAHNKAKPKSSRLFHRTKLGRVYHGDALEVFRQHVKEESVDLVMTSPPFGLVRKKDYGNVDAHEYLDWFRPFAETFRKAIKPTGSLVIDIGGSWIPGQPTRSLYHYELLIMLCKEFDFHLAQDFFWWSPSKLPSPAEWVNVRRIRVKDAINCIWWLSPTPWPKASNRRVLTPYSDAMHQLLKNGYQAKLRPSGHDISDKFSKNNGAAIPPNLIALPNTESNSYYLRYCKVKGIKPHPARFPSELPEYFIRMLTDPNDFVVDPFGGSCVTGEAAERTKRRWLCAELLEDYLTGALARFSKSRKNSQPQPPLFDTDDGAKRQDIQYRISHPAVLWNGQHDESLPKDGGQTRPNPNKAKNGKL